MKATKPIEKALEISKKHNAVCEDFYLALLEQSSKNIRYYLCSGSLTVESMFLWLNRAGKDLITGEYSMFTQIGFGALSITKGDLLVETDDCLFVISEDDLLASVFGPFFKKGYVFEPESLRVQKRITLLPRISLRDLFDGPDLPTAYILNSLESVSVNKPISLRISPKSAWCLRDENTIRRLQKKQAKREMEEEKEVYRKFKGIKAMIALEKMPKKEQVAELREFALENDLPEIDLLDTLEPTLYSWGMEILTDPSVKKISPKKALSLIEKMEKEIEEE